MKFNLHRRNVNEKSWNDTENFLATILCTQFSRKKDQFAHNIEQVHRGNYKNPNSPIYAKFLSWKVAQGVLKPTGRVSAPYSPVKSTLKKCNIEWTHYFWKKKRNSKKISSEKQGRATLCFREYWWWKSQYRWKRLSFWLWFLKSSLVVVIQMYSSPGLDVGGLGGGQYFLGIYGQFT